MRDDWKLVPVPMSRDFDQAILVALPTGQILRLFEIAYSRDGIVPGGVGFDEHADHADELGELL